MSERDKRGLQVSQKKNIKKPILKTKFSTNLSLRPFTRIETTLQIYIEIKHFNM